MLRLRRYRIFLVFAVIALGAFYHFSSLEGLENAGASSVEGLKHFGAKNKEVEDQNIAVITTSTSISATKETQLLASSSETRPTTISDTVALSPSPSVTPKADHLDTSTISTFTGSSSTSSASTTHTSEKFANGTGVPNPKNVSTTAVPARAGSGPAPPALDPGRGDGRQEVIENYDIPKIHWSRSPEHFPVPSDSLIQLPTGKPKPIPKIQYDFPDESPAEKKDRQKKLEQIKKTFEFSWDGYVKNAWMQDELSPVSGKYRNPFCGWAATLVDSLDTLWIMGMTDAFENATAAIQNIDFTTSIRKDIPMFETTIRYLGGLLGAYDISGRKNTGLLDKAVELAEILMGAFDTPNRMPMTYYMWQPAFASQPHRARTRVVLAELGSMSLEFTRLAQITKEAKYYDAIARITNEFEIWQNNTKMPGLWPKSVDASGCKKPSLLSTPVDKSLANGPGNPKVQSPQIASFHDLKDGEWVWQGKEDGEPATIQKTAFENSPESAKAAKATVKQDSSDDTDRPLTSSPEWLAAKSKVHSHGSEESTELHDNAKDSLKQPSTSADSVAQSDHSHEKRQLRDDTLSSTSEAPKQPDCEPQGLESPPNVYNEEFTLGGQADSVYEYLPKEYMLLGGLKDQYRTMYEATLEPIEKYILFRPMIPDEKRDTLFAGLVTTTGKLDNPEDVSLKPENTHLTCFTGGMYAIGAKIFGRESDLDVAKKLTDGCVWSYEATTTGIMPEYFLAVPCDSTKSCPWNETKWYEALAPKGSRVDDTPAKAAQAVLDDNADTTGAKKEEEAHKTKPMAHNAGKLQQEQKFTIATIATTKTSVNNAEAKSTSAPGSLKKRQLDIEKEVDKLLDSKVAKPPSRDSSKIQVDSAVMNPKGNENLGKSTMEEETPVEKEGTTATKEDTTTDQQQASTPIEPDVPEYTPPPTPTQEEYAKSRIHDERLPIGITKLIDKKYILRYIRLSIVFCRCALETNAGVDPRPLNQSSSCTGLLVINTGARRVGRCSPRFISILPPITVRLLSKMLRARHHSQRMKWNLSG